MPRRKSPRTPKSQSGHGSGHRSCHQSGRQSSHWSSQKRSKSRYQRSEEDELEESIRGMSIDDNSTIATTEFNRRSTRRTRDMKSESGGVTETESMYRSRVKGKLRRPIGRDLISSVPDTLDAEIERYEEVRELNEM